ncbi:metallophosphoesterase [Paenibacillus lignilyticus]|uniref:Metallophosphoesterase n=1 Tax=Paenibacillus lignilyticus TaxID=1172615 RepID=A0ABS5CE41_9BACL|nr:metallophosphoesterase [Paenibacillus lignilyticus]MBP3964017.1 metallophosphoesterase [Paenibacillus lignilyticus]
MAKSKVQQLAENMIADPHARPRMVEWFNPKQLVVTGMKTILSTIFGLYSDFRLIEAFNQKEEQLNDYSKQFLRHESGNYKVDQDGFYLTDPNQPRDEIWIDYISDLGDGFDSTYSIAYYATRPELSLVDPETGTTVTTKRGNVLIFGGDQVYPTANRDEYMNRLIAPYYLAQGYTADPHPQVFAVPGNHDWYDGLISFSRIFTSRKWFNGWQAPQQKSYFALKLPHGWWLLGTDVQLNSDIDGQQVRYFEHIAAQMQGGDRVILCNAEPYWVSAHKYGKFDPIYNENNLTFLENMLKKNNVDIQIFIAGDLHHYRRFEFIPTLADGSADHSRKVEKITAGGGGAFLHPTHDLKDQAIYAHKNEDEKPIEFKRKKDFPDVASSRRLTWGNLLFVWKNQMFGIVTAILYLLACNSVLSVTAAPPASATYSDLVSSSLNKIAQTPSAFIWMIVIIGGFWLFTDTHFRLYKWIAGCLHGLTHVAAAFFIGCAAVYLVRTEFHFHWGLGALAVTGLLIAYGGWIIGSVIMGLYLLLSLNGFGRHSGEAFSAMQIDNWKNFIRIHIDKDGSLTIFPIGMEHVVKKWKRAPNVEHGPLLEPDLTPTKPSKAEPIMIETPIRIPAKA